MKTAIAVSIAKRRSSRAHSPLGIPVAVSGSMEAPERTSGETQQARRGRIPVPILERQFGSGPARVRRT